jgi:membrane protease YdiL (CAAX protease family)
MGDVAAGLAIAITASVVVQSIAAAAAGWEDQRDIPMWAVALLQIPLWIGLLGAPLWAAWAKGNGAVVDFGARVRPVVDAPLGIVVGFACQYLMVPIVSWPVLQLLGKESDDLEKPARDLADKAHGPGVLLLVLVVVIGAPLVEELFFRGLALQAIARRFGPAAGVIGSAVLFGLVHFAGLQLPALIVFGLVAALLVRATGRLGPSVLAHMGFNLAAVIQLLAQR